jgi:hypothetical protein
MKQNRNAQPSTLNLPKDVLPAEELEVKQYNFAEMIFEEDEDIAA